jgi:hypothetical protein
VGEGGRDELIGPGRTGGASGIARRRQDARDGTTWDRRQPLLDDRSA